MEFDMIKKISMLFIMTLFLTGCIKTETQLTIKRDGSGFVQETISIASELLNKNENIKPKEDLRWNLELLKQDNKLNFKTFESDSRVGFIGSRPLRIIKEDEWNKKLKTQTLEIKTKAPDETIVYVEKKFLKTYYTIDCEIKPYISQEITNKWLKEPYSIKKALNKNLKKDQEQEQNQNLNQDKNQIDTKKDSIKEEKTKNKSQDKPQDISIIDGVYRIKIPVRAEYNNADEYIASNYTYSWDLKYNTFNPVQLKFSVVNIFNVLALLLILGLIIVEIYYFQGKDKRKRR